MTGIFSWHLLRWPGTPPAGRGRKLLAMGVATLLLLWSAPILVGHTPLCRWLAQHALPGLSATVSIGRVSCGWFSPVVLQQVELRDRASRIFFVAAKIESRKSLLALLGDHSDLGAVRVEQAALHITFSGRRSNLEEVFASWRAPDVAVGLEAKDAQFSIHDEDSNRRWSFSAVNVMVTVPRHGVGPTRFEFHAHVADPGPSGWIDIKGVLPRTVAPQGGSGSLSLRLDGFPLALATPLVRRTEPSLQLEGRLQGHLNYSWNGEQPGAPQRLDGVLSAKGFSVQGSWLAREPLQLENLELAGRLGMQARQLQVGGVAVRCALGHALLDGTVDMSRDFWAMLTQSRYELRADVNLARAALALPHALRVRGDTALTAGQLHLEVTSSPDARETSWKGQLRTSELAGIARGRQILWPEPLAVDFRAHQPAGQAMVLDHFRCASDFLQVEASGARDRFSAKAGYDLGRLAERLNRFIDLGSLRLAGRGLAQAELERKSDGRFTVRGEAEVRQLELAGWNSRAWRESHLTLWLDVAGKTEPDGRQRVDSANLRLQENEEKLQLQLLEPVADALYGPWGSLSLYVRGDLAQWQRRLWPQVAGHTGWQLAGIGELRSRVSFRGGNVEINELRMVADPVQYSNAAGAVVERQMVFETSGHWLPAQGRLELAGTKLQSEAVSLKAPQLLLARGPEGKLQGVGTATLAGDLARLHRWTQGPLASPREGLSGQVNGQIGFQLAENELSIRSDWTLTNLALARRAGPSWHEPRVHMLFVGRYNDALQALQIEQFQIESLTLSCTGTGSSAQPTGSRYTQVTGWVTYNIERLGALLRPYLGSGLAGAGQDTRLFRLEGAFPNGGFSHGWLWLSPRGSNALDGGACLRLPQSSEPSHFWRQLWWALRR